MAVRDTILNQHIISLESRIAPKDTVKELYDKILQYDKWSIRNCSYDEAQKLRVYIFMLFTLSRNGIKG